MSKAVDWLIDGRECRLYFSVAALFKLAERFGERDTLQNIWQAILPPPESANIFAKDTFENVLAVAAELIQAGAAQSRLTEDRETAVFSAGELAALLGQEDYITLYAAVVEALRLGIGRSVETENGTKKEQATQGN